MSNTKRNKVINELVDKLQPVIMDQIYESIDWQMDGVEYCDELDADEYILFHSEVFTKLLKQLNE